MARRRPAHPGGGSASATADDREAPRRRRTADDRHRDRPRHQAVRRLRRGRRRPLLDRRGRVLLDARPVGLRQDHDAADDRRLRDADRGRDPPRGRGRLAGPAVQAQREHRLPAVRAVPAHDRVRTTSPSGLAGQEGRQGRDHRAGSPSCSSVVRLADFANRKPGAALRWPAAARRPRPGAGQLPRARCCSTSRSAPSTSSSARRCSSSSSASSARSASPSSSSPTIRKRRSR